MILHIPYISPNTKSNTQLITPNVHCGIRSDLAFFFKYVPNFIVGDFAQRPDIKKNSGMWNDNINFLPGSFKFPIQCPNTTSNIAIPRAASI